MSDRVGQPNGPVLLVHASHPRGGGVDASVYPSDRYEHIRRDGADVGGAVTWGVILLDLLLFITVAIDRRWWPPLLVLGLAFHSGIVLVHGLVSFFFAMAGALLLYLRATDRPFTLPRVGWSRPRILAVLRLPGLRVAPVELPPVVTR